MNCMHHLNLLNFLLCFFLCFYLFFIYFFVVNINIYSKPDIDGITRQLLVQLWDEDMTFDDFRMYTATDSEEILTLIIVGQVTICPKDLPDGEIVDTWYPLKNRPNKKDGATGGIYFLVDFNPIKFILNFAWHLHIIRCACLSVVYSPSS